MDREIEAAEPRPPSEVDPLPVGAEPAVTHCRACGYPAAGLWILTYDDGTIVRRCPNCMEVQS